jgi:hypothetical protein
MSITLAWDIAIGAKNNLPLRDKRPVLQLLNPNKKLLMTQYHRPKKCLAMRVTVLPHMASKGGELTRITKNKNKLRIVQTVHPASKQQNPDGSYPPKKYIWRFTVVPQNDPPCACEFVHIGLYHLQDGKWGVNQERPVMLLVPDSSLTAGSILNCGNLFPPPTPKLYPQFDENGEYRVVMVKNLLYDIYPPATFVRTEYEGPQMNPVDREVILTEIAHIVFVYEGCGGSFFLINAECD